MSKWNSEREALLSVVQRMASGGLVAGVSGNASICLQRGGDDGLLLITPSQMPYDRMSVEDLVVVDFAGDPVEGDLTPSIETLTHAAVYKVRKDVGGVVHTHSVYATVLAVTGLDLPPIIDELVVAVGGTVRVADYGFPGSEELAEKACLALEDRGAVILRNHGLLGAGATAEQALSVCELVERAAQIFVLSSMLSGANPLPQDIVETERALYLMKNNLPQA